MCSHTTCAIVERINLYVSQSSVEARQPVVVPGDPEIPEVDMRAAQCLVNATANRFCKVWTGLVDHNISQNFGFWVEDGDGGSHPAP